MRCGAVWCGAFYLVVTFEALHAKRDPAAARPVGGREQPYQEGLEGGVGHEDDQFVHGQRPAAVLVARFGHHVCQHRHVEVVRSAQPVVDRRRMVQATTPRRLPWLSLLLASLMLVQLLLPALLLLLA